MKLSHHHQRGNNKQVLRNLRRRLRRQRQDHMPSLHDTTQSSHLPLAFEPLESRTLLSATMLDGLATTSDHNHLNPTSIASIVATFDDWALDDFASITGTNNNLSHTQWGSTDEALLRLTTAEYSDGISAPAGDDRPSARVISNALAAQNESVESDRYVTDMLWLWGQFIDHDIDLTGSADPVESFNIAVPTGDAYFDPFSTGIAEIDLTRSVYDTSTGDSISDPRQQVNLITAYIDGSVIYGSDQARADWLRTFENGMMKTSEGNLLPFNEDGFANANANPFLSDSDLFLAGDVRANENVALTAMHTVWLREHNRQTQQIATLDPTLSDEEIYQRARAIVTAQMQAITFNEFLPALLGYDAIDDYQGYDATINPGIANVFSTALYRLGHSLLSTDLWRLDAEGNVIDQGNLSLSAAFFAPNEITENGIEALLRGASVHTAQSLDNMVVDDVRNFLFGAPGSGGFDLASLNVQRGRDHGLADYNQVRVDLGLEAIRDFGDITSNADLAQTLETVYGSVDNIDVWVGALAEDHVDGASVGELIMTGMVDQFQRIRAGDRFWYENIFDDQALMMFNDLSLSDVIERNTNIESMPDNVFYSPDVMFFEMDGRANELVVTAGRDSVDIINPRNHRVLASADIDEVSQIMIIGNDAMVNHVTIDASLLRNDGLDRVVFNGGHRFDTLTIHGTRGLDVIDVNQGLLSANGMSLEFTDVERINIRTGSGADEVFVADDMDSQVTIDRGQARAGHQGQGHNEQGHSSHDEPQVSPRNPHRLAPLYVQASAIGPLRLVLGQGLQLNEINVNHDILHDDALGEQPRRDTVERNRFDLLAEVHI